MPFHRDIQQSDERIDNVQYQSVKKCTAIIESPRLNFNLPGLPWWHSG